MKKLAIVIALLLAVGAAVFVLKQNPVRYTETHPDVQPIEPPMADIPGGTFTMGDDARGRDLEKPAHPVEISPFRLGKYEVTNEEYKRFCDATGRAYPPDPDWVDVNPLGKAYFTARPVPVIMITWSDMATYCGCPTGRQVPPPDRSPVQARRAGFEGRDTPGATSAT
jgi:formylglycine-generating enzyme required for sulfatase activity